MLISYIWVPCTTMEGTMKNKKLNNTLLMFWVLDHKNDGFSILEHFFVYLTVRAPWYVNFERFSTSHLRLHSNNMVNICYK